MPVCASAATYPACRLLLYRCRTVGVSSHEAERSLRFGFGRKFPWKELGGFRRCTTLSRQRWVEVKSPCGNLKETKLSAGVRLRFLAGHVDCWDDVAGSQVGKGKETDTNILVLGIETSCDDTGAAVVSADGRILGEAIASQADLLSKWGGVVPKLAQEEHEKFIDKVVAEALSNAQVKESDLSAVAVTIGPGLSLCLRVGVRKARAIARDHRLWLVGVHHMEAHALVVRLTEQGVQFPFLVLLVSGGHNLLLLAENVGQYTQLGTTIDDAIGEAYDKTARLLGLDMRHGGGSALEQIALEGDPDSIKFSVPMRNYMDCNFSYAGLKNQVRLFIESSNIIGNQVPLKDASSQDRQLRANIAASFQRVAVQHLEDRCQRAVEWARIMKPAIKYIVVSGGVASNETVRGQLGALAKSMGMKLVCPPPKLCTDNGVMVAWAGVEHLRMGIFEDPPPVDEADDVHLDLRPRWQLGEVYSKGASRARSVKHVGNHPSLTAQVKALLNGSI